MKTPLESMYPFKGSPKRVHERMARAVAQVVHDRIVAKAERSTLGAVLETTDPDRTVMILRDCRPVFVGIARTALSTITAFEKTEHVKRVDDLSGRYIYL